MSAGEAEDGVFFVVDLLVALPEHVGAGVDQKNPEDRNDPVEAGDQGGTGGNHDAAHDESAEDAPLEDAMLHGVVDLEGTENNQEDDRLSTLRAFSMT